MDCEWCGEYESLPWDNGEGDLLCENCYWDWYYGSTDVSANGE